MKNKLIVLLAIFIPVSIVFGLIIYASKLDLVLLQPSGEIARRQHEILRFAFWLSMFVIIPVFILLISISYKYRKNNKKSAYDPEWGHNRKLETIWWGIPIFIIIILSLVTWRTSHTLDPYKELSNSNKPIEVQVVALQWKWLFLYPNEGIASVNYLQIPEDRPINLTITADAPMNSLWIPKLGGQVYAMNGMSTKLHLIANELGEFNGVSSNISGEGFADMNFKVTSVNQYSFNQWIESIKTNQNNLDYENYSKLSEAGVLEEPKYFSSFDLNLYNKIIDKYMSHSNSNHEGEGH